MSAAVTSSSSRSCRMHDAPLASTLTHPGAFRKFCLVMVPTLSHYDCVQGRAEDITKNNTTISIMSKATNSRFSFWAVAAASLSLGALGVSAGADTGMTLRGDAASRFGAVHSAISEMTARSGSNNIRRRQLQGEFRERPGLPMIRVSCRRKSCT